MLADELAFQITDNFSAVLDGKKSLSDAAKDIAVNTAKNSAIKYTEKKGKEIITEGLNNVIKLAEKEIENKILREVTTKFLNSIKTATPLINLTADIYDMGVLIKRLWDGEITPTEFLQIIGEKGTGVIVSGVFASGGVILGGMIDGAFGAEIGGVIGSMVGYIANSFFYNAIMQVFNDDDILQKRYEAMHDYCENLKTNVH